MEFVLFKKRFKSQTALVVLIAVILLLPELVAAAARPAGPTVPRFDFVPVRGGTFRMGCPSNVEGCLDDERPDHQVRVNDFLLMRYPVTQAQWVQVMGRNPSHFQSNPQNPVEQVSWRDVQVFIEQLNRMTGLRYRLPTEAEWEFAAQGGRVGPPQQPRPRRGQAADRAYLVDSAWYNANSRGTTQPVGQKLPNSLGLHDMMGNVWEWVNDIYDRDYYRVSPTNNPQGPQNRFANVRAFRGGSFMSEERHMRTTIRNHAQENYRAIYLGFRLALDL